MRWHSVVNIMYDSVITLIQESVKTDEYGDSVKKRKERTVFAELMSIGMKEFYQAQENGKKPELKFKLADYEDYQGEDRLAHEGVIYKIMRTYRTQRNELEITVYGGVKNVSA